MNPGFIESVIHVFTRWLTGSVNWVVVITLAYRWRHCIIILLHPLLHQR